MAISQSELHNEWQSLPKDWYSIYQWKRITGAGYCEWISPWIAESLNEIELVTDGLRRRSFHRADHCGQVELQTGIEQINEKRLLRAMYNNHELPNLGKVIDYEIPLKEKSDSSLGDIDMLCVQSNRAICVEGKKPNSSESILKPLIQAFTYTMLVETCKSRFLKDFGLDSRLKLTPALLTFATARSGIQLRQRHELPNLLSLIHQLNDVLQRHSVDGMRFFVIDDRNDSLDQCLIVERDETGQQKPKFRDGFIWQIREHLLSSG